MTFGGQIQRSVRIAGLAISETIYPPGTILDLHYHPYPSITFVVDGGFVVQGPSTAFTVRRHALLIKSAGVWHIDRVEETGVKSIHVELLELDRELLESVITELAIRTLPSRGPLTAAGLSLVRELAVADQMTPIAVRSVAMLLIAEIVRSGRGLGTSRPSWLDAVLQYLNTSYAEGVSILEAASRAHVHPAHLARAFRAHLGCTVGQYARRIQLEHATALLVQTQRPLTEIALTCGFCDQSHFTRAFKRWTGTTPRRYREAQGTPLLTRKSSG